ncbi:MAG: oxygen-dependent coproporphyrinogen oxidase [Bacteroidales bacterium]|nr:oxygen-dependent coproporphyrinogen oxidase [Bacteroidales bacterium]
MGKSMISEVASRYREIQDRACEMLEKADSIAKFSRNSWEKEIGSGMTRVLENGAKIEKAAINFSHVSGEYTSEMAKMAGRSSGRFAATGVSSIIHPVSPLVPIIHMNIRYFELNDGTSWFGGGIDLTPHYVDKAEASWFHKKLKGTCDLYDLNFYSEFKKQADDYFFLPHRNETRGVGGVFFDQIEPSGMEDFEKLFDFTSALGKLYPEIYSEILGKKSNLDYSEKEKSWQYVRRGRYVEFNLLYDRGTKFGLASGGNTESILLSMPPQANWAYQYLPEEGSLENETLDLLKKDIDWINL